MSLPTKRRSHSKVRISIPAHWVHQRLHGPQMRKSSWVVFGFGESCCQVLLMFLVRNLSSQEFGSESMHYCIIDLNFIHFPSASHLNHGDIFLFIGNMQAIGGHDHRTQEHPNLYCT